MTQTDNFARVEVTSPDALRAWLLDNWDQPDSVWLVTFKKAVADKYVSREAVLDELLCFGWIDGIRRQLDDQRTMQLISPRKTQHWAKSYKDRVARLTQEGRMHSAGLASVAQAKASGLWTFMDDVDALIVPDDLEQALAHAPPASDHWAVASPSYRRNLLRWIKLAKTDATRASRIAKTVSAMRENRKIPNM